MGDPLRFADDPPPTVSARIMNQVTYSVDTSDPWRRLYTVARRSDGKCIGIVARTIHHQKQRRDRRGFVVPAASRMVYRTGGENYGSLWRAVEALLSAHDEPATSRSTE